MAMNDNDTGEQGEAPLGAQAPLGAPTSDGAVVLERLRLLPGGPELLAVANEHAGGVELVGGAVRDIMLGNSPRELDVAVAGDVEAFAGALAQRLQTLAGQNLGERCEVTLHERFGTAVVRGGRVSVDIATVRAESYASPGALPDVAPGTPEQDLERRDFTVNAIAVALAGEHLGRVRAVAGALEDLQARRLRVLHDTSFLDDPTRILRLVRYSTRLGFEIELSTAQLVSGALAAGALKTVSGQRLGAELRLALAERDAVATLAELDRLGVFAAWEPGVSFDEHLVRTALEIMPADGSTRMLFATALLLELSEKLNHEDAEPMMRGFLYDLELPSGEGEDAFSAAIDATVVAERVADVESTEDLLELLEPSSIEALALAAALCTIEAGPTSFGRKLVEDWLNRQRHITLQITGDDLIAAGMSEGPEIGRRLEFVYEMLFDDMIEAGREAELQAAIEGDTPYL